MPPCPRFNCYVFRHVQVHGREIPDGAHAAFHQFVRHFLRGGFGHRDDADEHVEPPYQFYDFGGVEHFDAGDLRVDALGIGIERGDDVQAVRFETAVADERRTQPARADDDGVGHVVVAEHAVDVLDEVGDLEP